MQNIMVLFPLINDLRIFNFWPFPLNFEDMKKLERREQKGKKR